jgi:HD-like signal output (HDOD) protein
MIARRIAVRFNTMPRNYIEEILYIVFAAVTVIILLIFIHIIKTIFVHKKIAEEKEAQLFLKQVDKIAAQKFSVMIFTHWNFDTDINDQNENKVVSLPNQNLKLYIILFYHSISCCQ